METHLTDDERAHLQRLAEDAANADLAGVDLATSVARAFLRQLRRKYGDQPGLLEIEASYTSEVSEAEHLLLAGYAAAEREADVCHCRRLALSLAEFHLDDLDDERRAREWVAVASTHLAGAPSDDLEAMARLRAAIDRRAGRP